MQLRLSTSIRQKVREEMKDEEIKKIESEQLIDELSKMPPKVIATAYLHAINYTTYGEDVTEKWVTATQNARALEKAYREGYSAALQKMRTESEEDILKFYYVESLDDYWIGERMETMYYAKWNFELQDFVWTYSKYLPWGKRVVAPNTLWKEYTYPSEPKEIPFKEWIKGFLKKYGGRR